MSNWTHVCAIFRIDEARSFTDKPNFEEIFGKQLSYYASENMWEEAENYPERFLPFGSEGSLEMTIWENPDMSSVDAYTISIFGDLRDHDSADEIIEWFDNKCEEICQVFAGIRQAVITVDNEWYGQKTKAYNWISRFDEEANE